MRAARSARVTPAGVHGLGRAVLGVPLWSWAVGLVVSLAVMGPALGPGSLLNLDLVLVPNPPVPAGMWGLGPELPRRVPMWGFMAWISALISGNTVGKVFVVVSLTLAFVGMYRLLAGPVVTRLAAGLIYAFNPFLLTRVAVGHWMVMWTAALLPWALQDLLRPARSPRRVLWWSAAIGIAGVYGAVIAGMIVAIGLIRERGRRAITVTVAYLVGQLPWLVPMVVVSATTSGASLVDASVFAPAISGFRGVGQLLAGQGFWDYLFQLGRSQPWLAAVVGFGLLVLAVIGTPELPSLWRLPVVALAAIAMLVTFASLVPGVDHLMDEFTQTSLGAPFRDTQRILLIYFLWLAPAAASGAARLGRWVRGVPGEVLTVVPLAAALVLLGPSLWGFGGQWQPVQFPNEWAQARAAVERDPGTMVAFPWYQYFTTKVADHHLVIDVVPYYFGGDVISASDPQLSAVPTQEVADPRQQPVGRLADAALAGRSISGPLADLGVRWLVLQHDVAYQRYRGILDDPGLQLVADGNTMSLYRVKAWKGDVWQDDGRPVPSTPVVSPLRHVDASGSARFSAPYQPGWMRGWAVAGSTHDGLIRLPAGSGLVWYWPTLIVLAADVVTMAALGIVGVGWLRRRRGRSGSGTDVLRKSDPSAIN